MKRVFSIAAMLATVGVASAQTITTPADAFNAGKDFANTGKGSAANTINGATGSQHLPNYGTTAPETSNFQNGRALIGGNGMSKQLACQTYKAPNGFQQQECDAVNFLSKNSSTRPKYTIDKKTDPLLTGSKTLINSPGSVPGASSQQCRVERVKNPATYITETCTESQTLENVTCSRKAVVSVTTAQNCTPGTYYGWAASACASRDCDRYTAAAYCDGGGALRIYVFAAGNTKENWGRNCSASASGMPINLNSDGTGGGGFSGTTNFHRCNNGCCGGFSGSVTGNGCTGDDCTATVAFTSGASWDGRSAIPANLTVNYKKPIRNDVAVSWANGCSALEARAR